MTKIRVGTASWTDASLIKSKPFYLPVAKSGEDGFRYYGASKSTASTMRRPLSAMPRSLLGRRYIGFISDTIGPLSYGEGSPSMTTNARGMGRSFCVGN